MHSVSILIPVYNYDIVALVHNLGKAVEMVPEFCEVIIGDDGSSPEHSANYQQLARAGKSVKLYHAEKNIGRASIRNRLAEEATGDFLLFIDADAMIPGTAENYLRKWLPYIIPGRVICGGTTYPPYPPADPDKWLRWRYGKRREERSSGERNRHPYASFSGFNFLAEKALFGKIRFNEELKQYGHEDTLLGYQLKIAGIEILHIDNPLIHDGIEPGSDFIAKTKQGVENLSFLCDKVTDKRSFAESVRLVKIYNRLSAVGANHILTKIYIRYRERMEVKLASEKGSILLFGLFKMSLFATYRAIHKRRAVLTTT